MLQKINETADVVAKYSITDKGKFIAMPVKIRWRGREYIMTKLGYPHKYRQGRTLIHIFEVCNDTIWFRLRFDTETLHWWVEGVADENGD